MLTVSISLHSSVALHKLMKNKFLPDFHLCFFWYNIKRLIFVELSISSHCLESTRLNFGTRIQFSSGSMYYLNKLVECFNNIQFLQLTDSCELISATQFIPQKSHINMCMNDLIFLDLLFLIKQVSL